MRRTLAILACLLLPFAQARFAAAGEPQGAPPDTAKAGALFEEGSKASEQENWDLCRAKLSEAWSILKRWQIAANLGACELKLGMHRDAAEHISFALRGLPGDTAAERRAVLSALLDEASAKIVTLTIKTDPPDAAVLLDGKPLKPELLEAPIFLEVRTYALEIRAEGRETFKETIAGRAGLRKDIVQRLDPVAVAAPPAAPPPKPQPKPEPAPVPVQPEAPAGPPGPRVIPIVIGGAVAVVALGVGVGLTLAANGKADDALGLQGDGGRSACANGAQDQRCVDLQNALASKDFLSNAAVASFLTGGAVALATAGFTAWELSRNQGGAKVRAAPAVGMSGGGVVVVGSW